MHILNLIQCTHLGGMERASLRLMNALQRRGHSFQVLSLNPLAELAPLLDRSGIAAEGLEYRGKGGWRSFVTLRRKLRSVRADALLMTGHNLLAMLALGDLWRERRILAVHFHHTGTKPAWQWRFIYRQACRYFQAITFPSDFIRCEAEAIYPPVAAMTMTVRNPLELPTTPTPEDRRRARRALGLPETAPIVGNAGWLIPRKRFDIFLRVARAMMDRVPEVCFPIAGIGPERAMLEQLARSLGVTERIVWLGSLREMENFYHSLDLLLFNSDWDAFPTTPLEAISYGVPVVASVVNGGLKEMMQDGKGGVLLPRHDVEELAGHVIRLLADPDQRRLLAANGRAMLKAQCSPDVIAEQHECLWAREATFGRMAPPQTCLS